MQTPIEPLFGDSGPLAKLSKNRYGYTEVRYPLDLGQDKGSRYPYHMKFYINQAELSSYKQDPKFSPDPKSIRAHTSKDLQPSYLATSFRRKTIRSSQSIALYMPDTLNWSFANSWKDWNLTHEFGKLGSIAELLKSGTELTNKMRVALTEVSKEDVKTVAAPLVESIASMRKIGLDPALGLAFFGVALNPNVEVLYQTPELRSFQFEFVFAPRNEKEAQTAIEIIQLFKFHAAPENWTGGGGGRYFVPPSDFDIEFHGPDGELWQFGKIIPNSVLKNITVNYGQSGQFAVLPGNYPTNIQLMLEFQETHFITKGLVAEDGY